MALYDAKIKEAVRKFPDSPGVYIMRNGKREIIYIGKAASLKKRVGSYFNRALNPKTELLVADIRSIDFRTTDSAMEALILEANLIKLYKPYYNIRLKDDKYFVNIIITDEEYPRVLIVRATDRKKHKAKYVFGPYTSKYDAGKVIDFLAKLFCRRAGAGATSGLYRQYYIKGYGSGKVGDISRKEYIKIISYVKSFLEGKKSGIIRKLEREMQAAAAKQDFEQAAVYRDQLFALRHIRDAAFLRREDLLLEDNSGTFERIEGYDISNISGEDAVGSMVVFRYGRPDKDEYRKFKINRVKGANDPAMMREILRRRFGGGHGWKAPDVIVMDGGIAQVNAAKTVMREFDLDIPLVGIAKGPDRKGEKLFFSGPESFLFPDVELIKKVRDEAHRFAVSYHRKLRRDKIRKQG